MNIYVYNANVYCEDCALALGAFCPVCKVDVGESCKTPSGALAQKFHARRRVSGFPPGDSNDLPQGPYESGQEETDSPSHCGWCHVYLEQALTTDGVHYVLEKAREALQEPRTERNRIMPMPGTGEDEPGFRATWAGKRHVEIVRTWAEHLQDQIRYAVERDGDTPSERRPGRFLALFLAMTAE